MGSDQFEMDASLCGHLSTGHFEGWMMGADLQIVTNLYVVRGLICLKWRYG